MKAAAIGACADAIEKPLGDRSGNPCYGIGSIPHPHASNSATHELLFAVVAARVGLLITQTMLRM